MTLEDIVNRPLTSPITQSESLYVIKEYIEIRKNKYINPEISSNMFAITREIQMMFEMCTYAIVWLKNNNYGR